MQIKVASYKSFNAQSFNDISFILYNGENGDSRIILSLKDPKYAQWLECIEEYIALGKWQYFLGNRKRAYRIYVVILFLIDQDSISSFPMSNTSAFEIVHPAIVLTTKSTNNDP